MMIQATSAGADTWCRRLGNFQPLDHAAAAKTGVLSVLLATLILPAAASAQMGGGMGGHGGHGGQRGGSTQQDKSDDAQNARTPNPLRAMLAEVRKLRADLLLTETQIGPWLTMEDALRDCVELRREQARPNFDAGTTAQLNAQRFVQDLDDDAHAFAESMDKFSAALKAALAALDPHRLKTAQDRLAAAIETEMRPGP